jgi:hypothetical protein
MSVQEDVATTVRSVTHSVAAPTHHPARTQTHTCSLLAALFLRRGRDRMPAHGTVDRVPVNVALIRARPRQGRGGERPPDEADRRSTDVMRGRSVCEPNRAHEFNKWWWRAGPLQLKSNLSRK